VPDRDQLSVAGVDDRMLPALGSLCLGCVGFTGLGHHTLPRRLEIVFAGVQVAAVLYFRLLRARTSPVSFKRWRPRTSPRSAS
jgi:hypothetical protein